MAHLEGLKRQCQNTSGRKLCYLRLYPILINKHMFLRQQTRLYRFPTFELKTDFPSALYKTLNLVSLFWK